MNSGRGTLVLVGTPIGNREDFSPRARRALLEADLLLCEDTRSPLRLFDEADRERLPRRVSCFVGNEHERVGELLQNLDDGKTVAFVSEAGMPVWSDPGHLLVRAAIEAGHAVDVVPGPTAAAVALSLSGLEAGGSTFVGFIPRQGPTRALALARIGESAGPSILYEAGNRLRALLSDLMPHIGDRGLTVGRELTKRHQEVLRGTSTELLDTIDGQVRGEVTVVIEGAGADAGRDDRDLAREAATAVLEALLDPDLKPRERARIIAEHTGLDTRGVYQRLVDRRER